VRLDNLPSDVLLLRLGLCLGIVFHLKVDRRERIFDDQQLAGRASRRG